WTTGPGPPPGENRHDPGAGGAVVGDRGVRGRSTRGPDQPAWTDLDRDAGAGKGLRRSAPIRLPASDRGQPGRRDTLLRAGHPTARLDLRPRRPHLSDRVA